MKRFWGWLAHFASKRLGYSNWVPVDIDGTNFALLLIPDSIVPEDFLKAVEDSQDSKVASSDCCNKGEVNEAC